VFQRFDRERQPIWPDYTAGAGSLPRRLVVIDGMRATGVLDSKV
jgi:hypothetical protein